MNCDEIRKYFIYKNNFQRFYLIMNEKAWKEFLILCNSGIDEKEILTDEYIQIVKHDRKQRRITDYFKIKKKLKQLKITEYMIKKI